MLRGLLIPILLALVLTTPAAALEIEVLAQFRDQVMIRVDGVTHKLRPGQSTPDGVRLVSSDVHGALLELDGQSRRYPMGAKVRSSFKQAESTEFQIFRDQHGMFRTVGSINGMPVNFLVDTGATTIAMNSAQARRLGIDYRVVGEPGSVVTASRVERIYRVRLATVKVGEIQLHNVEAGVLEGPLPAELLLGMSFLGRLEMQNDGQRLVLRKKY